MHDKFCSGLELDALSRLDIAAEAASEYARRPTYEGLWRNQRRQSVKKDAPRSRTRGRIASLVTIVLILLAVAETIALREKVVRVLPSAALAYSAIGLPVNLAGLELRSLKSRIILDGSRRVLTIEGEIVNLRREPNCLPRVALTVRANNGLDRYSWTIPAPKARLEARETIAFRARLSSPPPDGAAVVARFASAKGAGSQEKAAAPNW